MSVTEDSLRARIRSLVQQTLEHYSSSMWADCAHAWISGSMEGGAAMRAFFRESQLACIDAACSRNERMYAEARLREHVAGAAFYLEEGDLRMAQWLANLAEDALRSAGL